METNSQLYSHTEEVGVPIILGATILLSKDMTRVRLGEEVVLWGVKRLMNGGRWRIHWVGLLGGGLLGRGFPESWKTKDARIKARIKNKRGRGKTRVRLL